MVKSLFHRAFMICSTKTFFNNQIEIIKSFMSLNLLNLSCIVLKAGLTVVTFCIVFTLDGLKR